MRGLLRHRPSPAMVVACVALAIALGGTSYAAFSLPANSVGTKQLRNGAVTKKKINKQTVASLRGKTGPQGPPGPSTGPAGGDLTGSYPNPSITAGAVTGAKVANDTLGGSQINEANLVYSRAGCQVGLIHSFGLIKGASSMPSTYTTSSTYLSYPHNCSGGTVEVRRAAEGHYFIRFNGDPAALALVASAVHSPCTSSHIDQTVTAGKVSSGGDAGAFEIFAYPTPSGIDSCVTVVTF